MLKLLKLLLFSFAILLSCIFMHAGKVSSPNVKILNCCSGVLDNNSVFRFIQKALNYSQANDISVSDSLCTDSIIGGKYLTVLMVNSLHSRANVRTQQQSFNNMERHFETIFEQQRKMASSSPVVVFAVSRDEESNSEAAVTVAAAMTQLIEVFATRAWTLFGLSGVQSRPNVG